MTVLHPPAAGARRSRLITRHTLREEKRRLNILLVEDNPVNRAVAVRMLERRGHKVTVAHTGREALDLSRARPFEVALMDLQMPERGGLEATAAIRERERATGKHLPIVAMTAHAMKGDRERCLAAGMDGYLAKPIQAKDLFEVIDGVLSQKPLKEGARQARRGACGMKILIAEDDPVSRRVLEATLLKWGYEVTTTSTGTEAWAGLNAPGAPRLAILDW